MKHMIDDDTDKDNSTYAEISFVFSITKNFDITMSDNSFKISIAT